MVIGEPFQAIASDDADGDRADRAPTARRPQIFISYRIDSDSELADALKQLLEASLFPSPVVFVAGSGGLQPSNVGYKRQLQEAVRGSDALVGVITEASKNREWLFFEAGAAWGRDLLYVPVLFGPRPADLPSSIADNQAINGQALEDMRLLINVLGSRMGARVRFKFERRYQMFSKRVERHLKSDPSIEMPSALLRAMHLASQGHMDEADEIFEQLKATETDVEERAYVAISQLRSRMDKDESPLMMLERLPTDLQSTTTYFFELAFCTERPESRKRYIEEALRIGKGRYALLAKVTHAQLLSELGLTERACEELFATLRKHPNNWLAGDAASTLIELAIGFDGFEKLCILLSALVGKSAYAYSQIARLAESMDWKPLWLHACEAAYALDQDDGAIVNNLGRIRQLIDLPSLAYQSYAKASVRGASVAKCNMAALVKQGSAAAALAILKEHEGAFDSSDPSYPFQLRAKLEEDIRKETDANRELSKKGQAQFTVLWALAERALNASARPLVPLRGRVFSDSLNIEIDENDAKRSDGMALRGVAIRPFGGSLLRISSPPAGMVFIVRDDQGVDAVYFDDFANAQRIEWLSWNPSPS